MVKTVPHLYYNTIDLAFLRQLGEVLAQQTRGPRFEPTLKHGDFTNPCYTSVISQIMDRFDPQSQACLWSFLDNEPEVSHIIPLYFQKRNTQWPLWLPRKQYAFGYAHFLKRNYAKLVGTLFHWLGGKGREDIIEFKFIFYHLWQRVSATSCKLFTSRRAF